MTSATTSEYTLGFLYEGDLTAEQTACYELLNSITEHVKLLPFDECPSELSNYDLLWWYRETKLDEDSIFFESPIQNGIRNYLEDGGDLFLGLFALEAVVALDIDPTAPDHYLDSSDVPESGLLIRSLFRDHPAFDGIETLRYSTLDRSEERTGVAYRRFVPKNGDILASHFDTEGDDPMTKVMVEWGSKENTVLGLGYDCHIGETDDKSTFDNIENLYTNLLQYFSTQRSPPAYTGKPKNHDELSTMRAATDDTHRPGYHISPPANWLNDPNGLIKWDGTYHVFYQYNPAGPYHGTIHWGHAVSDDLVHWEDRPIALSPDPETADGDGCWSGCAVDNDGEPTIVYTGGCGRTQIPCLATSDPDDGLVEWDKYDNNPIISEPPGDFEILSNEHWEAEFRDHCIWFEDDRWFQLVGSGIQDVGGTAILYESSDLYNWEYRGPILTADWNGAGTMWECPELLQLGDADLLHVSNYSDVVYFLGTYTDGKFEPDHRGKLDYGDFYAPQSLVDDDRIITWGWLTEARDEAAQWNAGWSGMLSLPRVLSLDSSGDLVIGPAEEITTLREERYRIGGGQLHPSSENPLADIESTSCEIVLRFDIADAWELGLSVFQSPDGDEQTVLRYTDEGLLVVDRDESSQSEGVTTCRQTMPVSPDDEGIVELRCFLDESVIEIFANDNKCLTSRVYPDRTDSRRMELFSVGGTVRVESLDVWTLGDGYSPESSSN